MSEPQHDLAQDELDRLLNDPTVPMQADRIWALLAEVARQSPVPNRMQAGGATGRT